MQDALLAAKYTEFDNHKHQAFANRDSIGGKQFCKQLPVGNTVYETTRVCDFFIVNRAKFPKDLIIECKWQQVSGSVDEKYPYLLFNAIKTGVPTIVLIDGEGYRPAALKWLKDQVTNTNALRGAWNMMEFQKQVNDGFFG